MLTFVYERRRAGSRAMEGRMEGRKEGRKADRISWQVHTDYSLPKGDFATPVNVSAGVYKVTFVKRIRWAKEVRLAQRGAEAKGRPNK